MNYTERQELQGIIKKAMTQLNHPWRKMRDNAIDWFMSADQGEESFLRICAALQADPGQIRGLVEKTVTRRVMQRMGGGVDLRFRFGYPTNPLRESPPR